MACAGWMSSRPPSVVVAGGWPPPSPSGASAAGVGVVCVGVTGVTGSTGWAEGAWPPEPSPGVTEGRSPVDTSASTGGASAGGHAGRRRGHRGAGLGRGDGPGGLARGVAAHRCVGGRDGAGHERQRQPRDGQRRAPARALAEAAGGGRAAPQAPVLLALHRRAAGRAGARRRRRLGGRLRLGRGLLRVLRRERRLCLEQLHRGQGSHTRPRGDNRPPRTAGFTRGRPRGAGPRR